LAALPEQIQDVTTRVPGRAGSGVLLAEVLALAGANPDSPFVVVASDGMTTNPVAQSEVGSAILVHSLEGASYPTEKGGPFRIFVPPGEGQSACSNVKKVVRIVFGT
jgi:DMSO/TMAO reductase YedYZ molybdopterin-dependent catalytic subunit